MTADWRQGSIADLAHGVRGVSYRPEHLRRVLKADCAVLLRATNIQAGQIDFGDVQVVPRFLLAPDQAVNADDIVMCMSNGSKALVGKSARCRKQMPFTLTAGAFCSVFHPRPGTSPSFVAHVFQGEGVRRHIDFILAGSAINNLRNRDIEACPCRFPEPTEQAAIAGILDMVDEAIWQTTAVIEKLKKIKVGLLHDMLTRGIGEDGQLRNPVRHPEQFRDSPLGKVPKTWEVLCVGDLLARTGGHVQTGPFGSQLHAFEYVPAGIPVVMPQDIYPNGQIRLDAIARITPSKAKTLTRHCLAENDLVFARRGELSRCAPIGKRETGWLCGTGCLLMRPSRIAVLAEWFAALYRHAICQRPIAARAVGSTMVNLNTELILGLVIPYPELGEQEQIVELIRAHDARVQGEEATLRKLTLMKQGLMQDLLTGRVRVKSSAGSVKTNGKARVQ
jgi:type I restriction enzyme S subunit